MAIMIMPMAGNGVRTAKIFNGPKPLIEINGKPMFYWAAKNINVDKKIFIVRQDHVLSHKIDQIVKNLFPDSIVLIQKEELKGQLLSILIAKDYFKIEEDIILVDCDMYSDFDISTLLEQKSNASILTFKSNSDNYSYVQTKENYVIKIAEKSRISEDAVAGVYYWKKGYDFLKNANLCIKNKIKINNEYYVSGAYAEAVKNDYNITIVKSKKTYDLSIKEDINNFIKKENNKI